MLDGYVCVPPTLRQTPYGKTISDTIIAVNRRIPKADYLPVIAWSRNAAYLSRLNVSTKVTIQGRIQSRNYIKRLDDNNYEDRVAYEVSVSTIGSCEYAESTNTTKEILQ
jgi:single-stranded DNA-binding protein